MMNNQWIKYKFVLESVSPLYFGSSEETKILRDEAGHPLLLGNTIGGILRSYLETTVSKEQILYFFGGVHKETSTEHSASDNKEIFVESKVYISDANIAYSNDNQGIKLKVGTKINQELGVAENTQLYHLEYLAEGAKISFEIECHIDTEEEKQLDGIIHAIKEGIQNEVLLFGGQTNNGFGHVKLNELTKKSISLNSIEDIDKFIRDEVAKDNDNNWTSLIQDKNYKSLRKRRLVLEGCFPYGVFQHYPLELQNKNPEIRGLQSKKDEKNKKTDYFIPATSLKGIMRFEIQKLLKRMNCEQVEEKVNELFGHTEQKGKLQFKDIIISNGKVVEVDRAVGDKETKYNKIDRITGGVIESTLFTQQEIQGNTKIEVIFNEDKEAYVFPVLYTLWRIAKGEIPIGGRTNIGLGVFEGTAIDYFNEKIEIDDLEKKLKDVYTSFKGWCDERNNDNQ